MTKQSKSSFLENERNETDNSLIAERDKATESLKTASTITQTQTDRIVRDERVIMDQKTAASRRDHDETRKSASSNDMIPVQLTEERHRTDIAAESERSRIDAAIAKERLAANQLVNKVLEHERKDTDKNLLAERQVTDLHVHVASDLLKTETAAHEKTKISLTSRDEFLAIVSHDLRNPIGAVSSYAEILLEESQFPNLGPQAMRYIGAIKRNADASLRLIEDILDVERFALGKLQISICPCNLNQLIREAIETFEVEAAEKNVRFLTDLPNATKDIDCDRDRVIQVLSNLLGNALKYTPDGGSISIKLRWTDAEAIISIQDKGIGIPDGKKEQIFERFAQLKSKDRNGLGLGLYISKMLIEAHRGRIWVESKVGLGSTFFFAIPAHEIKSAEGLH